MSKQEQNGKKEYQKPEAKRFPLRPEEAVLGFCKTSAASGPSAPGCRAGVSCSVPGS